MSTAIRPLVGLGDVRFEMSESIADFRIRSMMCAPLLDSDGNALGMLQIDTLDQRQRFQEEDLELLVSAAAQASNAIDNARLHEEALRQRTLDRDLQLARYETKLLNDGSCVKKCLTLWSHEPLQQCWMACG